MRKGHWHGDPSKLGTDQAEPVGWMDGVNEGDCEQCESRRQSLIRRPPYIKENRFGGDLIEYGAISALFDDLPASEVTCTSGAQSAFTAAKQFIMEMVANQCKLAGCTLQGQPYGVGDVHTEKCWFTQRALFYRERAAKHGQTV